MSCRDISDPGLYPPLNFRSFATMVLPNFWFKGVPNLTSSTFGTGGNWTSIFVYIVGYSATVVVVGFNWVCVGNIACLCDERWIADIEIDVRSQGTHKRHDRDSVDPHRIPDTSTQL